MRTINQTLPHVKRQARPTGRCNSAPPRRQRGRRATYSRLRRCQPLGAYFSASNHYIEASMRIIGGEARGRPLVAPKGRGTRPSPARVREALFSMLGSRVHAAQVLDLFAGSGALSLEAVSRGAAHATLVERDRAARAAIARNARVVLGNQGARTHLDVLAMDITRALGALQAQGKRYDLVFADPPYGQSLVPRTVRGLQRAGIVASGGLVVCEHPARERVDVEPPHFGLLETRKFGDVAMTMWTVEG